MSDMSFEGENMVERKKASPSPEKESEWRARLQHWRASGLSQAEYCRTEGLNHHTFSSWKYIIRDRDKQVAKKTSAVKRNPAPVSFAKVEIQEETAPVKPTSATVPQTATIAAQGSSAQEPVIAAELINIETGLKIRIFCGADQPTVSALVSAWSSR